MKFEIEISEVVFDRIRRYLGAIGTVSDLTDQTQVIKELFTINDFPGFDERENVKVTKGN